MDAQLQQLIELQQEQNQLLKRHLWRLRFSLLGLLIMTTILAVVLGIVAYQTRRRTVTLPPPLPNSPAPPFSPSSLFPPSNAAPQPYRPAPPATPAGDINLKPTIPSQT
jgi:hypothetical protein